MQGSLGAKARIFQNPGGGFKIKWGPRRELLMRNVCPLMAVLVFQVSYALAAEPPIAAEHFTVETLAPKSSHWIYVFDEAFSNAIDARLRLFDGDTYRHLGQIDAGFSPGAALSPDGKMIAVATTYFARGGHGARADVVEFTDTATLAIAGEIVLPPKRAQLLPSYFNVAYASDGRFIYVAYITPAASFGVLDVANKTVLSEIDTAGCVMVIPSGTNRVSSLCDNGRLLTVTLDAQGHEASRSLSEEFFNADRDPIFMQGVPSTNGFTFLSFLGQVRDIDFSAAQPVFHPTWSLVSATEQGVWRPGGMQVAAIHRRLGRMYVPMHRGGEGSHKEGGSEIWVFDLDTHRRIARWPISAQHLSPVVAVQVSQDDAPLLFTAGQDGTVAVFDARSGHLRHAEKNLGETPWQFLNP
jgi:methylamine dehydrogenase heavy chain